MDLLRIARHPNNLLFALCISIIAHFAFLYVLGVLPFSRKSLQEESILVDFTLGGTGVREQGAGSRGEDIQQISKPAISKNTDSGSIAKVTQDKIQTSSIDLVSLSPAPGQRGRGGEAGSNLQKGGGEKLSGEAGKRGSGEGKEGGGTGKGSGSSGGEGGNKSHDYGYVREIVMKHLKYPEKARRMGLEGRVIMSFIITEAGLARDIKVVESSGFQMLDDAAGDAISRVNLSRNNPNRLIVHLPVEFRLR